MLWQYGSMGREKLLAHLMLSLVFFFDRNRKVTSNYGMGKPGQNDGGPALRLKFFVARFANGRQIDAVLAWLVER